MREYCQRNADSQFHLLTQSFTCSQHDRRVAVVGAADNGGDDHRAVGQLILLTTVQERYADILLLLRDVEAFEANLQGNQQK